MSNYVKDLFRTIKNSIGRFLAIAGICALGIGFFGGLQMTCGSMKETLTNFYNDTNMMDIRIVCNLGLSQENVDNFKNVEGVDGVMPSYETDILTNFGNDQCAVRVHSLPDNLNTKDKNYINQQILTRGGWPALPGECVLSEDAVLASPPEIGDEIQILECSTGMDTTLSVKSLKVVGFVRSSYYVGNVQMGPSTLGKGTLNQFAYVNENTFHKDFPYSEIFITVKDAKDYVTGTDNYQKKIDEVMVRLLDVAPVEAEIRSSSLKQKAQEQLDIAKLEFETQKQNVENELNSNEKKLNDAWNQIESSEAPLHDAENLLNAKYEEFRQNKALVMDPLNESIQASEYIYSTIKDLLFRYKNNIKLLDAAKSKVDNFDTVKEGLNLIISETDKTVQIDKELISLFTIVMDDPIPYINFLNKDIDYVNSLRAFSSEFLSDISIHYTRDVYLEHIQEFHEKYTYVEQDSYFILASCEGVYSETEYFLNQVLYPFKSESVVFFNELEKTLIDASNELNMHKEQLKQGKDEIYLGYQKFYEGRQTAYDTFLEAESKLKESQNSINDIDAKIYIMDRNKNFGAINFINDSERIASIANVFPLIFFFVALLVALTSMTRMIEEERITIGTYKALGFSKLRIANKYILYGVVSSFFGSIIGLLILCQFLPFVIMFAYSIIYIVPINLPMPFDINIGVVSLLSGVVLTVIATLMSAVATLRLVPARLMIPTAPKAGKRILLERIKPIWKIMNFNWKISFRNMFLYKKRLFMTLIGIAGCTALLLTGFGLHDSISDIMNEQFDVLTHDNFKVVFNENASNSEKTDVSNIISSNSENLSTLIHEENMVCMPEGHPNASTTIIVPNNIDQFQTMRVMRNRNTKDKFVLDDDGVYISEKLASMMGVSVGDEIVVYNQDLIGNAGDDVYHMKINEIVENYIAHYIYMTSNVYKYYFGRDCTYNSLMAYADINANSQQAFIDKINENSCVKTSFFTTSTRGTFETMLKSVNLVVIVLIVSAGLLAFVVLYNLININICERSREIATLKVLGANRKEVNFYIHRETFTLSILGSIIGLGLGYILEQFVIQSAEVDYVMFGRIIYWWSYCISFSITLLFTILVIIFMRKKLFSISMVESLSSLE